jgi:hypothetical protein
MLEGQPMKNLKSLVFGTFLVLFFLGCSKSDSNMGSGNSGGSTGEGGSMAAMTIVGNNLYRIAGGNTIEVYDISGDSTVTFVRNVNPGTGLETLFPYKNYLFVGTNMGMHILDISNGSNPVYKSTYEHVVSCDPVVVQGNYAYVTLRNGTLCNRGATQLEIIDISNVEAPYLLKTIPMLQPHGLDIDGKNLIVTEGNNGFKWFDASNPINPQQILFEKNVAGFDIISRGSEFILIGADGLFQYEYGNNSLTLLSKIPVAKP